MDHLILPDGASPYIIVPYKCTESYDGGDFLTYPERKGWTKDIEDYDFSRRTPAELNAFFQTWLFFGCLTEVLKAGRLQVDMSDFIDTTSNTVTTKKLPQLIVQWRSLWPTSKGVAKACKCRSTQNIAPYEEGCGRKRCWQSVVRDRNSSALRTTRMILRTVFRFIDLICGIKGNDTGVDEDQAVPPITPLDPEIALSISALGSTLLNASNVVYECRFEELGWGGTAIMKERFQQANWCPSRIAMTIFRIGIEGLYFCAANPMKEAGDHSKCSTRRCVAQTVDEDHYPTRHVPGCSCEATGVPLEELLDIIRQGDEGHTPVVTWAEGTDGLPGRAVISDASAVNLLPNSNVCRYVAISHVWSEGLGNPTGNTLPICQISRIQKMVDELFPDRGVDQHVPFWMDTLCVPVGDNLKEYRKKCIIRMRTIYQEAAAVLVLDVGMQEVSSSASIPNRAVALFQSEWWRRLWTYQEGILANRLYLRLSDGVQDVYAMGGELQEYYTELEQRGYTSTTMHSLDVSIYFGLGRWYTANEHKRDIYFLPMSDAISNRRTTRGSDETLCLPTVLGIHPAPFLRIEGQMPFLLRCIGSFGRRIVFNNFPRFKRVVQAGIEAQVIDRRMELFLHYIRKFARGIIFNSLPRLKRDGYRWAPRSLLGNSYAPDVMGAGYNIVGVDHPAYEAVLHTDRRGIEGLVVRYPGMCLQPLASRHPTTVIVGDGEVRYRIRLHLDETSDFSGWNHTAQYNLVLAQKPVAVTNVPQEEHPVLVEVRRRGDLPGLGSKVIRIRYVCRAWVTLIDGHEGFDVKGKILPEESVVWFML
ncbi:hypothetical protein F5J12DRAFT_863356 [Pisolithus orientalis]|uniref:uncharacterized protein n=1 Tax=Pisolithus orientalis TaxID=936130 RepID=UPI0022241009|nr:uncharacterized protein F5J12DRAFT_863356 [Pisolithus orientalis]KAI5990026.1 hypothetical protein F5J12DRAFT_863356 [Pisolithus orientalis]